MSVQDIVGLVGTSQSNISQHLAILRNRSYYRVSDARTLALIGMMRDGFCGFAS